MPTAMFDPLALVMVLATAPSAESLAERKAAWYDCLRSYAQSEIPGEALPVVIALGAMAACRSEQASYQSALLRERGSSAPADILVEEDRAAAKSVIAFINASR
jgi:hypothetical protein